MQRSFSVKTYCCLLQVAHEGICRYPPSSNRHHLVLLVLGTRTFCIAGKPPCVSYGVQWCLLPLPTRDLFSNSCLHLASPQCNNQNRLQAQTLAVGKLLQLGTLLLETSLTVQKCKWVFQELFSLLMDLTLISLGDLLWASDNWKIFIEAPLSQTGRMCSFPKQEKGKADFITPSLCKHLEKTSGNDYIVLSLLKWDDECL